MWQLQTIFNQTLLKADMKYLFNYYWRHRLLQVYIAANGKNQFCSTAPCTAKKGMDNLSFPVADGKYMKDSVLVTNSRFSFKAL